MTAIPPVSRSTTPTATLERTPSPAGELQGRAVSPITANALPCACAAITAVQPLATTTLDCRIPVVDMADLYSVERKAAFLQTLYTAMTTVGFFAVRNTGISKEIIDNSYAQAQQFFKQPDEVKALSHAPALNGQRGFVPGETAQGAARKDRKEFYHIGREGQVPGNVWAEQPGFRDALTALYEELRCYVAPLQRAIVETLNSYCDAHLDVELLNRETEEGNSLLRALYYPALTPAEIAGLNGPLFWGAPHTDIDNLAILPRATEKGLQVQIDGQWLNVVAPDDAFIVNVGDFLENRTNGLFKSARHQVVAQEPGKDRFSMVFFVHPVGDTELQPLEACLPATGGQPLYGPGTRDAFLWERLIEIGLASPELLALYARTGHYESQKAIGRHNLKVEAALRAAGLL